MGNTRGEVERLKGLLVQMQRMSSETVQALRKELSVSQEEIKMTKDHLSMITKQVSQVIAVHVSECERTIQEREHQMCVEHEIKMNEVKKLLELRDEDLNNVKLNVVEKETELAECERLVSTIKVSHRLRVFDSS